MLHASEDRAGSLDQQIDLSLLLPPPDSAAYSHVSAFDHARRRTLMQVPRPDGARPLLLRHDSLGGVPLLTVVCPLPLPLQVRGLSFFATTLLLYDSENATIADCSFTYASASYAASLGSPWGSTPHTAADDRLLGVALGSPWGLLGARPLAHMLTHMQQLLLGARSLAHCSLLGATYDPQPAVDDRKQKIES